MSITYTPQTNFTAKDTMATSNPDKVLSGVPFDAEFTAISTAFTLAAPTSSPTFSGTATFDGLTATTINGSDTSNWDAAYTSVSTKEAGWDTTKTTVDAGATNWDTAYGWGNHADAGYAVSDTTYTGGNNITISAGAINLDPAPTGLTNVGTAKVTLGSWEIKLSGSELVFCYGGTNRLRMSTDGTFVAEGNVTAYGSA